MNKEKGLNQLTKLLEVTTGTFRKQSNHAVCMLDVIVEVEKMCEDDPDILEDLRSLTVIFSNVEIHAMRRTIDLLVILRRIENRLNPNPPTDTHPESLETLDPKESA